MATGRQRRSRASEDVRTDEDDNAATGTPSERASAKPSRQRPRLAKSRALLGLTPKENGEEEEASATENTWNNDDNAQAFQTQSRLGKRKREGSDAVQTRQAVKSTDAYKFFEKFTNELFENKKCVEFRQPVLKKYTLEDVPNYNTLIKKPMDLGTIKDKIARNGYVQEDGSGSNHAYFSFNEAACGNDLCLVFENCVSYNDDKSAIHKAGQLFLKQVRDRIQEYDSQKERLASLQLKREFEKRRGESLKVDANRKIREANITAAALTHAKREVEEAHRKRDLDMKRKEAEWQTRLETEKKAAVQKVLKELMSSGDGGGERTAAVAAAAAAALQNQGEVDVTANGRKVVNTSSVSSDEQEGYGGDITFAFVSTLGMEKKRGRKSARVMDLEFEHEALMKRRRAMLETASELDKLKQVEMSLDEKKRLCEQVGLLDFVRMKGVVDILAKGMNRPDIMSEVEVDVDVDHVDNVVLRDIQYFLKFPTAVTAKEGIRSLEAEIADIETKLVHSRYQKVVE